MMLLSRGEGAVCSAGGGRDRERRGGEQELTAFWLPVRADLDAHSMTVCFGAQSRHATGQYYHGYDVYGGSAGLSGQVEPGVK